METHALPQNVNIAICGFNILFIRLNGNFAEKAQAENNEKLLVTQENDRLQTAQEEYPFQALRNAYPAFRIIWMSSVTSIDRGGQ